MGGELVRRLVVPGALALSIAANVYLIVDRHAPPGERARAAASDAPDRRRTPPRAAEIARTPAATPFASCTQDLAATRAELERTKGELDAYVDAQTRFAEATRDEALEARVRAAIERALAKGEDLSGDLECRGDTCQVHVSAPTRADALAAWKLFTKDPDVQSFADSFAMDAGEPVTDPVTGKGAFDIDFYITTKSVSDLSPRLTTLLRAFATSAHAQQCHARSRDAGVLEVKVTFIRDERTLALAVGGSLAGTPAGRCLHEQLAAELARFEIPDGVTFGEAYASFEAPHAPMQAQRSPIDRHEIAAARPSADPRAVASRP